MSRNKQRPGKPTRVPSVQQLTGSTGPVIEAVGRKWRLGFNDQNAKGSLEELIRAHITRRAIADKRIIGGEEGMQAYGEHCRLVAEGFYETFGPGWLGTLKSTEGILLFLQSLLLKNHPDVAFAQVEEMFATEPEQCMAAVEVVAPDFFAAVAIQKGYSTSDARTAAPQIAAAIREQFARSRQTPPVPVTDSATVMT